MRSLVLWNPTRERENASLRQCESSIGIARTHFGWGRAMDYTAFKTSSFIAMERKLACRTTVSGRFLKTMQGRCGLAPNKAWRDDAVITSSPSEPALRLPFVRWFRFMKMKRRCCGWEHRA